MLRGAVAPCMAKVPWHPAFADLTTAVARSAFGGAHGSDESCAPWRLAGQPRCNGSGPASVLHAPVVSMGGAWIPWIARAAPRCLLHDASCCMARRHAARGAHAPKQVLKALRGAIWIRRRGAHVAKCHADFFFQGAVAL